MTTRGQSIIAGLTDGKDICARVKILALVLSRRGYPL